MRIKQRTWMAEQTAVQPDVPEFELRHSAWPIDQELLALDPGSDIRHVSRMGGGFGRCKAGELVAEEERRVDRQSKGIFTVLEAAYCLSEVNPPNSAATFIAEMHRDFDKGKLVLGDPSARSRAPHQETRFSQLLLVTARDLKKWANKQWANKNSYGRIFPQDMLPAKNFVQSGDAAPLNFKERVAALSGKEKWAELLKRFRELEGRRPREEKKGRRGALAELSRESGMHPKNLGANLDSAIQEESKRVMWDQLRQA